MSDELFKQSRFSKVMFSVVGVAVIIGIVLLICIGLFAGLANTG